MTIYIIHSGTPSGMMTKTATKIINIRLSKNIYTSKMNNKLNIKREAGRIILLAIFISIVLGLMTGCDENGGITIPSGSSNVSVSMKSDATADNPAIITITEAKALISAVQLVKPTSTVNQIGIATFVANFALDGSVKNMQSGYTVRDIYTGIKFQLHKPDANETPSDPEFKDGAADNQRYSFIIKGFYNGTPFTYKSKNTSVITMAFGKEENINLANSNITLVFNSTLWFKNGADYVNPSDPANEQLIENSLQTSFKTAFKDDNKDGQPD